MKLSSRAWLVLTAGAVLAASAAPTATAATARAHAGPAAWQAVAVPSSVKSPATLDDVSAASTSAAWAVGAQAETAFEKGTPLLLSWDGIAWSTVALPGVPAPGDLTSVSAASATDAWAVGSDKSGAVALHWNGTTWVSVSVPDSSTATVNSVAVTRGGTAWLAGSVPAAGGGRSVLVERWNGKAWQVVNTGLGRGFLTDVEVSASGDVWVGGSTSTSLTSQAVVAYSAGATWKRLKLAGMTHVSALLGISPTSAWAVGDRYSQTFQLFGPEVAHWNGSNWHLAAAAANVVGEDLSISPGSTGQPQWVGVEQGLSGVLTTLYAHYNGSSWSNVNGATYTDSPAVTTVTAHIPGTSATWSVGGLIAQTTGTLKPGNALIEYNH